MFSSCPHGRASELPVNGRLPSRPPLVKGRTQDLETSIKGGITFKGPVQGSGPATDLLGDLANPFSLGPLSLSRFQMILAVPIPQPSPGSWPPRSAQTRSSSSKGRKDEERQTQLATDMACGERVAKSGVWSPCSQDHPQLRSSLQSFCTIPGQGTINPESVPRDQKGKISSRAGRP